MACRFCGAGCEPFLTRDAAYEACLSCGYIQLERSLLPSAEEEKARYLLHRNDPKDPGYRSWLEAFLERAVLPWARPGCSVLDFGSGPVPSMARLLGERGLRASSYDPFFAPDLDWRRRRWDIVLVHEVAEHLAEPGSVFSGLAGAMPPGAALCVRTSFYPPGREAFAAWWYRMDRTHVGFFSLGSFCSMAARLGLTLEWTDGKDSVTFLKRPEGTRG